MRAIESTRPPFRVVGKTAAALKWLGWACVPGGRARCRLCMGSGRAAGNIRQGRAGEKVAL